MYDLGIYCPYRDDPARAVINIYFYFSILSVEPARQVQSKKLQSSDLLFDVIRRFYFINGEAAMCESRYQGVFLFLSAFAPEKLVRKILQARIGTVGGAHNILNLIKHHHVHSYRLISSPSRFPRYKVRPEPLTLTSRIRIERPWGTFVLIDG